MARGLASFTITADGNGDYLISIEDEDGETIELTATYDQIDQLGEAIEEALEADADDALEDDEGDEEAG